MTHASVPADQREVLGISDTLVSMISLMVSMDSNSYFVYESETAGSLFFSCFGPSFGWQENWIWNNKSGPKENIDNMFHFINSLRLLAVLFTLALHLALGEKRFHLTSTILVPKNTLISFVLSRVWDCCQSLSLFARTKLLVRRDFSIASDKSCHKGNI